MIAPWFLNQTLATALRRVCGPQQLLLRNDLANFSASSRLLATQLAKGEL